MDAEFLKYNFIDSYHGVIVKNQFKIGVRHLQMAYMLVCGMVMGAMRGSSVIAVLAMTDRERINDTYIQIHHWDRKLQGQILSSFFFGYALMLIPAELFLKRFNGKFVMSAVLIANGAFAVALPTIANRGGWLAVYNTYLCLGMTQASLSPMMQVLLERWLPPSEMKVFSPIVHAGGLLGIIISLPVSGLLSETKLGWELIFYSQGMMTLALAVMWTSLTASDPDDHPLIEDTEKEFIKETKSYYKKNSIRVPWRKILSCKHFWAVAWAHAASNAVFVYYLTEVPVFMKLFGNNLKYSCLLAMYPFIGMWLAHQMSLLVLDSYKAHQTFFINIGCVRKTVNALGVFAMVAGLTLLPNLVPTWYKLAILVLMLVLVVHGFQISGFLESYKNMSQNYAGSLFMLSRGVASWCGALVPALSGLVLADDETNPHRWFWITIGLSCLVVVGNVVYTALGSHELQEWDGRHKMKRRLGYLSYNQIEPLVPIS